MADKLRKKVVVLATNANGEAEFYQTVVEVTEEEYDLGMHYDKAQVSAEAEGYEAPFKCFDQAEQAARQLPALAAWMSEPETA
ncbi:hypothetical protein KTD31_03040 [Burkholderia multivorans]|uniref:hypothetical protein n=1 Tax=Burkholderia multivorans TaxID=87883 RepID=UPI001C23BAFE|nr:hypothetical protein [Burkholderia multivorans]MBU9200328.1 hypothetical protein [Burkholderia multivorans]MDN8078546.1 hypothetical protein [Burkholderia multivorans]